MSKSAFIAWSFLWVTVPGLSQVRFVVAEYNVENLFDCLDDEGKDDSQFLPSEGKRWTQKRLRLKLGNLGKSILSIHADHPSDITALIEVENEGVLKQLAKSPVLRGAGYRYIIADGKDARGIDVALLYQPETFRLLHHRQILPQYRNKDIPTRSILYALGRLQTGDSLHVIVCHLSSRLGGKQATYFRKAELHTIRLLSDSILHANPEANIIITGDFNDTPASPLIQQELKGSKLTDMTSQRCTHEGVTGSYKYDGHWENIDQLFVSETLLDSTRKFYTTKDAYRIHAPHFLLERDEQDGGWCPRRTYKGFKHNGGYSDHLPIAVEFKIRF